LEKAIRGLRDGTVKPEDVHIPGIETEEEKKQKEVEAAERKRKYLEKEEKLKQQRKQEEIDRWWTSVEIYKPSLTSSQGTKSNENKRLMDANTKEAVLHRYTADYSKWDTWTPSDTVSLEEKEQKEKEDEDKKNKEFEQSNPEFVDNFMKDMKERKKQQEKKQETAEVLRLKGNKLFKNKDFEGALTNYVEALKNCPFDSKLLLNIAQSFIKLKNFMDAEEFLKRTLYLDENNVKVKYKISMCFVALCSLSLFLSIISSFIFISSFPFLLSF
jgi:tetratricopeptide (TPR) repeat protein